MTLVDLDDIPTEDEMPRPFLIFEHLFQASAAVAPPTTPPHPPSTDAPPPTAATLPPPVAEPGDTQVNEQDEPPKDEPPKDEQGPRFKDQVLPGYVEPDLLAEARDEGKQEEEVDLQEEAQEGHAEIPVANALLLTDTRIELEDRVQQLDLERQQRQHLEKQLEQQAVSKKRWIRGIVVAAVGLAAGVAAFIGICGTSGNCRSSKGTSPMSTRSRSESEKMSITAFINNITLSNQTLRYPSNATAEERALLWLIDDDTGTSETNELVLTQRYVLGTLWFQTMEGFTNTAADFIATWTTDIDECFWKSVSCNGVGRVKSLLLEDSGLQGSIPEDLGLLTALTQLWLYRNDLVGIIPPSLGLLTAMRDLALFGNDLTGTIPSALTSMTNLNSLGLFNTELTGSVPFCSSKYNIDLFVTDCTEVDCPCCTECCPTSHNGRPEHEIC